MAFHRSLAELAEPSAFAVLLWFVSWRNMGQELLQGLVLVLELTDAQHDRIRIKEMRTISIQLCFLIAINREICKNRIY